MRSSSSEDICFCAQRAVVSPGSAVIKQRPGFCGERGEIRVVQSPPLALLYFKCFKCFGPSLSLSLSLSHVNEGKSQLIWVYCRSMAITGLISRITAVELISSITWTLCDGRFKTIALCSDAQTVWVTSGCMQLSTPRCPYPRLSSGRLVAEERVGTGSFPCSARADRTASLLDTVGRDTRTFLFSFTEGRRDTDYWPNALWTMITVGLKSYLTLI